MLFEKLGKDSCRFSYRVFLLMSGKERKGVRLEAVSLFCFDGMDYNLHVFEVVQ